jgi:hypothetical protein
VKLLEEIRAFGPELHDIWEPRIEAALKVTAEAGEAYRHFLWNNWRELVSELEPGAKRIQQAYVAEEQKAAERLSKLRAERDAIAEMIRAAITGVRPLFGEDVPHDPLLIPLPTEQAWRRYFAANPLPEDEQILPSYLSG